MAAPADHGRLCAWAELRALSREHLTPWEPMWQRDELSRSAFRRRVRHYQREMREDLGYAFLIFRDADDKLIGGLTLSQRAPRRHAGGGARLLARRCRT